MTKIRYFAVADPHGGPPVTLRRNNDSSLSPWPVRPRPNTEILESAASAVEVDPDGCGQRFAEVLLRCSCCSQLVEGQGAVGVDGVLEGHR